MKAGFSYVELKEHSKAKKVFRKLIERYPSSRPAEMARSTLEGFTLAGM